MNIKIYHNPNCTKSRLTLQMLEEKSLNHEVILYLKQPLDKAQIIEIKEKLGTDSVRNFMRPNEQDYKDQNLGDITDESILIDSIIKTPKLLERPIVINGNKAAIGRPPENILEII